VNDVWEAIADLAADIHPDSAFALAERLNVLESYERFRQKRHTLEHLVEPKSLEPLSNAWSTHSELGPREIASALKAATATARVVEKRSKVEMVWTGPSTTLVPSRQTERVLLDVIDGASKELFIVSFVAYNVENVLIALQNAIDRGVAVSILFESTKTHGGKIDIDSIGSFAKRLEKANFYHWSSNDKDGNGYTGSVHAKCVVADNEVAFITSANLTTAALERNMELGVLIEGGSVPNQLHRHLQALAVTKAIEKIEWTR